MSPREASQLFPDQYLIIEYDQTLGPIGLPHDPHGLNLNLTTPTNDLDTENDLDHLNLDTTDTTENGNLNEFGLGEFDEAPANLPTNTGMGVGAPTQTTTQSPNESASMEEPPTLDQTQNTGVEGEVPSHPPNEVQLPLNAIPTNPRTNGRRNRRRTHRHHHTPTNGAPTAAVGHSNSVERIPQIPSIGSDHSHNDVDPLAIDMTDPDEEEEAFNIASAMMVDPNAEAGIGGNCVITMDSNNSSTTLPSRSSGNPRRGTSRSAVHRPYSHRSTTHHRSQTISQSEPVVHPIPPPRTNHSSIVRRRSSGSGHSYPLNGGWVNTPVESPPHTNPNPHPHHTTAAPSPSTQTPPYAVSPSPRASRVRNHLARQLFRNQTRRSLTSVLDQDASVDSNSEEEVDAPLTTSLPELDTTQDTETSASASAFTENEDGGDGFSTAPNTPQGLSGSGEEGQSSYPSYSNPEVIATSSSGVTNATDVTHAQNNSTRSFPALSPVRHARGGRRVSLTGPIPASETPPGPLRPTVVSVQGDLSPSSATTGTSASPLAQNPNLSLNTPFLMLPSPPSPHRLRSVSTSTGGASFVSIGSNRSIHWTPAFDSGSHNLDDGSATDSYLHSNSYGTSDTNMDEHSDANHAIPTNPSSSIHNNQINLSFGPNTSVSDLKYFAERGLIVPLLRALKTNSLKTLGTRMLADYAKMPRRRVAVASNKRILEFCCRTMLEPPTGDGMGVEWPAREYAVETIRSLTATEDSDGYLMGCLGLLRSMAIIARGGPFALGVSEVLVGGGEVRSGSTRSMSISPTRTDSMRSGVSNVSNTSGNTVFTTMGHTFRTTVNKGLVSGKARLHACIAIMNLSCGKANKLEIASIPEILEAMRDVMMAPAEQFAPATSSPPLPNGSSSTTSPTVVAEEACLKAATCIKNLSNADANDTSLLGSPGLIEALGHVAEKTCTVEKGATNCTTNACLALMNLSISKPNKHRVFKTTGVMDALMTVIVRTLPSAEDDRRGNANNEARVKACSALSNLAIGYENKIPMFSYPGFVDAILQVIDTDLGEARTKACSILWSFAAEMKNQVPVVQRGDILPTLVRVAEEDHSTEARFKCVAALTLLAESLDNAIPLLESGALRPLMDILHDAGADPTQWKGQTASWCVGFLMNMAQSDEAVPFLREAGVVELLAPLLTLDHYQSLKAAMAVTFVCRYDKDDGTYDLLRQTENVIPKIISLLHNTLSGTGGTGYKYGVFTLRSSVGCISSLASGPEFMKERIANEAVFESLLRVLTDFCVNGGTKGAIVGGGRDDVLSATLAVRALHNLVEYLIPISGSSALPFGASMDKKLMIALESLEMCNHPGITEEMRLLAADANKRIHSSLILLASSKASQDSGYSDSGSTGKSVRSNIIENSIVASLVQGCCIGPSMHAGDDNDTLSSPSNPLTQQGQTNSPGLNRVEGDESITSSSTTSHDGQHRPVRTFLLTDSRSGRRYAVPTDPSGGRFFNDNHKWCYRRGRFCRGSELPDPNFRWNDELQTAYIAALEAQRSSSGSQGSMSSSAGATPKNENDQ